MEYWTKYRGHKSNIQGSKKKFDNTIYTFDIETSSYYEFNNCMYDSLSYLNLDERDKKNVIYHSCMYIWQFSINDAVYYGRTWQEFIDFIKKIEENTKELKYIYVHNLAFEFQYLKSYFNFSEVVARKAHKVMYAKMKDYNIIWRCSLMLSNCSLAKLPKLYNLDVTKAVGDLDYNKIRSSKTKLTDEELGYCERDCLVVYKYIKRELETYLTIKNIPLTSTGKVRRELHERIDDNYRYKNMVNRAVNVDPHIYNMLQDAFAGGYTHANFMYTDEIIEDVISYDETSAYPYVLVSEMFPSSEFKKCNIKSINDMLDRYCYLLTVTFKNIKALYYNHFISCSKCKKIKNGYYDNGRVIKADELTITLTDIDFKLILKTYTGTYHIDDIYYSLKSYLPKEFIEFVLEKYVNKTKYKNVKGKELEYNKEKNKFNSLYGMSVTNTIRDEVIYSNDKEEWEEVPLTNDEIVEKLKKEKNKGFLSFAYGVWVTAYARRNLILRIIENDKYVIYCDTDSIKLCNGYNIDVFKNYNKAVEDKIMKVSKIMNIDINKYMPKDSKGIKHMLGIFEEDAKYNEFVTQGAKKYAYKDINDEMHITVAGVPKSGVKAMKSLEDFKDNLVFPFKYTNKNILMYIENQSAHYLTDYQGHKELNSQKSGCCLLPTTYILGKSEEYSELITDVSSKRAYFKE